MKKLLALVSAILVAAGGILVAIPASAATPTPTAPADRTVVYTGTSTTSIPEHPEYNAAANGGVLPAAARLDCNELPCTLALTIDDAADGEGTIDMTEGRKLAVVDGRGTFAMAGFGTICDDIALPPGTLTVTATDTGFTGTRDGGGEADRNCPDGSVSGSPPFLLTFAMTLTSGQPCVIDDSCFTPTPTPTAAAAATSATTGRSPGHRAASAPSVLSALPAIATAVTVRNSVWAAAAAVVLVLLIAFPTHFFNQAAEKANDRFERWWKRRQKKSTAPTTAGRVGKAVQLAGWPAAAGGVIAASIISAFVDPSFGFDAASLRTFLSILVSFVVDVVIGWFALLLIVRKTHPSSTARFEFKPLTLLIVVVAVLFTRLTSFQPGIVFGLVAGVTFGGLLATAEKARVALIGLAYSFGIGIVAWVGYSLLTASAGDHPGAVAVFVRETLSGIAIAGSSSLPIALLPLRGLTGATVWAWKRWVWAVGYGVGLFGFMVMLMPMPFSWQRVPLNLVVWIALYLAYALVAVGLWLLVEQPWRKPAAAAEKTSPAPE